MTNEDEILDYEQLVADYNRDLFSVLRGHRSLEYLETWVPDADPHKGVLSMVEAAEISGRSRIAIRLGVETTKAVNDVELVGVLEELGSVETHHDGESLVVVVDRIGARP